MEDDLGTVRRQNNWDAGRFGKCGNLRSGFVRPLGAGHARYSCIESIEAKHACTSGSILEVYSWDCFLGRVIQSVSIRSSLVPTSGPWLSGHPLPFHSAVVSSLDLIRCGFHVPFGGKFFTSIFFFFDFRYIFLTSRSYFPRYITIPTTSQESDSLDSDLLDPCKLIE